MAKKKIRPSRTTRDSHSTLSSGCDELLIAAMERGDQSLETGRYIVTYRQDAGDEGRAALEKMGLHVADTRDFDDQAVSIQDVGDADALNFSELPIALVSGPASASIDAQVVAQGESPIETIEPEYFAFSQGKEYLRGFLSASSTIARELAIDEEELEEELEDQALGATWGLKACKVPPSRRSGSGIRVAILDTGMDLGHPDFAGRKVTSKSFVGQPVQDLNGHGTHCTGTACGPKSPPGSTPRYGIGYQTPIYVGKVLSNAGNGTTGSVLAGMNWAIAKRCQVISMSLGIQSPPQVAYILTGAIALAHGLLIVAAAGNRSSSTGAPANSPTILSVASLDQNLAPSYFSNHGKVDLAAPGRDVFSSVPMPQRYGTMSGTSMACPHVAGCAALWAQTSSSLRGVALWKKLTATARKRPYPKSKVGAGLVQAP